MNFEQLKSLKGELVSDASPSWNGFDYQSKIALVVVLEKILTNLDGDWSKYSLEFEWVEDFAIKCEGNYETIHQVKALDSTSIGPYRQPTAQLISKLIGVFPFSQLRCRLSSKTGVKEKGDKVVEDVLADLISQKLLSGTYILLRPTTSGPIGFKRSLGLKANQIKSLTVEINRIYNQFDSLRSVQGVYLHTSAPVTFKEATIRDAVGKSYLMEHLADNYQLAEQVSPQISFCKYSNGNSYSPILETNDFVKGLIKQILTHQNSIYVDSPERLDMIFAALICKIGEALQNRHAWIQNESKQTIESNFQVSFEAILKLISEPVEDALFASYILWYKFNSLLEKRISTIGTKTVRDRLSQLRDHIRQRYPSSKFKAFVEIISPHVLRTNESLMDVGDLGNSDKWDNVFLNFFEKIQRDIVKPVFGIRLRIDANGEQSKIFSRISAAYVEEPLEDDDFVRNEKSKIDAMVSNLELESTSPDCYRINRLVGKFPHVSGKKLNDIFDHCMRKEQHEDGYRSEDHFTNPNEILLVDFKKAAQEVNELNEDDLITQVDF